MKYPLLGLLCIITVIAYAQRMALSAPTKVIESELDLGPESMGFVMAVWFWGYAAMQLPAGWVADRLGSWRSLILFSVTWSVVTAITSFATGFTGLVLLWGLMGCTQAGLFSCCTKSIGATFPRTSQAFASGVLAACMGLGAAVAQWLTAQLLVQFTWQEILVIYAVPGLIWAMAFGLLARTWEAGIPDANARLEAVQVVAEPPSRSGSWTKLATDTQMQLLCGQQFLRAAGVAFFYTWFPRYLKETRGITEQEAGELAFWPPLAGMAGGLLGGIASEWILRNTGNSRLARQGMACLAMLVCAVVAVGAYFTTNTSVAVVLLCIGCFCGVAGGVSGYAVAISYGGARVATVFATMNMSGNIGAGLFPFVVGWMVAMTGNWHSVLLLFGGLFLASAACWALLNPVGTLYPERNSSETSDDDAS